jgi:hypothetical protein
MVLLVTAMALFLAQTALLCMHMAPDLSQLAQTFPQTAADVMPVEEKVFPLRAEAFTLAFFPFRLSFSFLPQTCKEGLQ